MFDPPAGAFFLGYVDGVAVAMGGWRMRSDVHPWGLARAAEVKRMYVAAGYSLVEGFGHYTWSPKSRGFGKPL
jgi:hypothetical protein